MPAPILSSSRSTPPAWLALLALAASVVLLLCLPGLDASGLAHSEGQRVVPGFAFADQLSRSDASGDLLIPRLFEQAYMRKPPGMPWAIALASLLVGQSILAARLVSVLSLVLIAMLSGLAARAWASTHSPRTHTHAGIFAVLIAACFPLLHWYPPALSRSAEIDLLHCAATLLAALALLALAFPRTHPAPLRGFLHAVLLALGFAGMLLTKGPAGIPTLAGVLAACLWVRFVSPGVLPIAPARWRALALAMFAGVVPFVLWALLAWARLRDAREPVVTQGVSEFLFAWSRLPAIILFPFAALISALPLSFVVVRAADRSSSRLRALALAVPIALVLYALMGVSNTRYALPALILLPPACGLAYAALSPTRQRWARIALIACICTAIFSARFADMRRTTRTSGSPDGERLGLALAPLIEHNASTQLWGDQLMDLRPEIALAARQACPALSPRWVPGLADPARVPPGAQSAFTMPPPASFVLLRTDGPTPTEHDAYATQIDLDSWALRFEGTAHNFTYRVYQRPANVLSQP